MLFPGRLPGPRFDENGNEIEKSTFFSARTKDTDKMVKGRRNVGREGVKKKVRTVSVNRMKRFMTSKMRLKKYVTS